MKAITLHQPYASLIALAKKQYETRNWSTSYRGKIAIHAGKTNQCQGSFQTIHLFGELSKPVCEELMPILLDGYRLPTGCILTIAQLTDCIKMTEEFINSVSELERTVGHWKVGNYAWKLENIQVLPEPILYKGKLGLWDYNPTT